METKRRTLVKAAVWQLLGFATMTLTGWIVTGSAAQGGAIAVTGAICGFVVYFFYERVWSRVRWGQLHTHDDGPDVANAPPAEEQTETGYGGPHRTTNTSVPEVCLARACLRRLNESSDTLATAEIRALGACEEPEYWLADRPRWVEADDSDRRRGEAHDPIVSRIPRLREQTVTQSPVEIVARMLNYVGLRPIATGWGPDAMGVTQRQRNLDAFLDLAVTYDDHCATQHEAANLTGLLVWLDHPSSPEPDRQPVVTGGDAVHVLAYHRAKGLEWPVVVATDFGGHGGQSDQVVGIEDLGRRGGDLGAGHVEVGVGPVEGDAVEEAYAVANGVAGRPVQPRAAGYCLPI